MQPIFTVRMVLREYTRDDVAGVHEYACDPETVRFMLWGPNTIEETRNFVHSAIAGQSIHPRTDYEFVVVLKGTDRIIGGCGIHVTHPLHQTGEIGYCFNKKFWGQGYATEAARALLEFGFGSLQLHRILATCDLRNLSSYRVMEKIGMRREGHFREHLWQKEEWRDTYLYAILEREWKNFQPG